MRSREVASFDSLVCFDDMLSLLDAGIFGLCGGGIEAGLLEDKSEARIAFGGELALRPSSDKDLPKSACRCCIGKRCTACRDLEYTLPLQTRL
jgi:hypothetical protein